MSLTWGKLQAIDQAISTCNDAKTIKLLNVLWWKEYFSQELRDDAESIPGKRGVESLRTERAHGRTSKTA